MPVAPIPPYAMVEGDIPTTSELLWRQGLTTQSTTGIVARKFNYIATETGANNAIAGALKDEFGIPVPQLQGLIVTIKLAHTLQAGANTFALNGATPVAIKSHFNVANNIVTVYAATGTITLCFDGGQYVDMSQ